jgi:RNA polymerase sigma factor (sigma-70 family)
MSSGSGTGLVRFIRSAADADGTPDAELVRRFASHSDEQAFRTLVARHAPVVWAVCRRMLRNHHDAEDAFQATFLVFARGASDIRNENAVGGWLCGVAGRVASRVRLKPRPEPTVAEPADGHPDGALGDLTVREAEAILYEELARLPEKYRDAVVLCCLEGLSRDEAAARLGWTENQVRNCLEQGRERLRSRLVRRGIALGVPLLTSLLAPPATAAPPVLATEPSAAISSLAHGVTRTMWIAKWKWAAAACAALVLTAGATVAAVLSQPQPEPPTARLELNLVPASDPVANAPEPKKEQPREPVEIAAAYLQHIIDGKPEQALKLADPARVGERYTKEIQVAGLKRVKFVMVLANNARVMVVTERAWLVPRPGAEAEENHVTVTLERANAGAPWVVIESDVGDEKKVTREVEHYLKGEFNAKKPAAPPPQKEPQPEPKDPIPARRVAGEFLTLVHAEKDAEALKLCVPGTVSANKVGEIRKAGYSVGITGAIFYVVLINDTRVEVVLDGPQEEKGELRHLVLMLTKSKDGEWLVKDTDGRDAKSVEDRAMIYLGGRYNEPPK